MKKKDIWDAIGLTLGVLLVETFMNSKHLLLRYFL